MLMLSDLIGLSQVDLQNFKIHLATGNNPGPRDTFLDGTFRQWQEVQTKENFKCDRVLSLIHLDSDRWLFAGIYQVHGLRRPRQQEDPRFYFYDTSEVPGLDHLIGRAIIRFKRTFRASYLRGPKYIDQLVVEEILPKRMTVGDFPGYHAVLLSLDLLRTIVRETIVSWQAALGSVAGVYVIVDTKSGRQYVGSASGEGGIWARWEQYANTGHGGNVELRELLKTKQKAYAGNFQFAILEICDIKAQTDYVLGRETHWKRALRTREFGHNKN